MSEPTKKAIDDVLFKKMPPSLQRMQKKVRQELRAEARRKWRDEHLQEQPPRHTHEGTPER
jgi:hypothetical protein